MSINTPVQDLDNDVYTFNNEEGYGQATATELGLVKVASVTPEHTELVGISPDGLLYSIKAPDVDLTNYLQVGDVYSKGEVDALVSSVSGLTPDDVYLKTEVYNKGEIDTKLSNLDLGGVKSVNNKTGIVYLDSAEIPHLDTNVGSELVSIKAMVDAITNVDETIMNFIGTFNSDLELPTNVESDVGDVAIVTEDGSDMLYVFSGASWIGTGGSVSDDVLLEYAKLEDVYTKDEVYSKDEVYNREEVYNKDEVYNKEEVYSNDEVYTKGEVDAKVSNISSAVASVNGNVGEVLLHGENVAISGSDLTPIKTYIDDKIVAGGGGEVEYMDKSITSMHIVNKSYNQTEPWEYELIDNIHNVGEFVVNNGLITFKKDYSQVKVSVGFNVSSSSSAYYRLYRNNVKHSAYYSAGITGTFSFTLTDIKVDDVIYIDMNLTKAIEDVVGSYTNYVIIECEDFKTANIADAFESDEDIFGFNNKADFKNTVNNTWEILPVDFTAYKDGNKNLASVYGLINNDHIKLSDNLSSLVEKISITGLVKFRSNFWINSSVRLVAVADEDIAELSLDAEDFTNAILLSEVSATGSGGKRLMNFGGIDLVSKIYDVQTDTYSDISGYRIYLQSITDNKDNETIMKKNTKFQVTVKRKRTT